MKKLMGIILPSDATAVEKGLRIIAAAYTLLVVLALVVGLVRMVFGGVALAPFVKSAGALQTVFMAWLFLEGLRWLRVLATSQASYSVEAGSE